jgi:hypothetical protein
MHGCPQSIEQVELVSPQVASHTPSPHWQFIPQSTEHVDELSPHWG